jgi:serine phosphatase RsbU (regulator of sigma subunit)
MQLPTMDELLLLSREEAVQRDFDTSNFLTLRWVLGVLGLILLCYLTIHAINVSWWLAPVAANLVGLFAVLRLRRSAWFGRRVRGLVLVTLVVQYGLFGLYHMSAHGLGPWAYLFPFVVVVFRCTSAEYLLLLSVFLGGHTLAAVSSLLIRENQFNLGGIIGAAVVNVLAYALAMAISYRHRRRFLEIWQMEQERQRDRIRMKQELEHAREIQLSMLPRTSPENDCFEVASVSLPATEVGGDYYDYFTVSDDEQAIVVGDVAGHGVASGLVLSGVRSCLHLLSDQMRSPASVIDRLHATLRHTTARRMFMTMGFLIIDCEARSASFACAGHPPMLHWHAASQTVDEVGRGALPLGTPMTSSYAEHRLTLEPDDVLLLYTDGVSETANEAGELFGYERLHASFAEAAVSPSATRIRDALLRTLWSYKGDAEQIDDVTIVVVRIRGTSG